MSLFIIPQHVLHYHVLPKLSLADLVKFDTAITSKIHRPAWLALLEGAKYKVNTPHVVEAIEFIVRKKIMLISISLPQVSMCSVLVITRCCKQLQSIVLKNDTIVSDTIIKVIAFGCHRLRFISVAVPDNSSRITNESLVALGENCPRLKRIDLTVSVVSDDGLIALVRGCSNLQSVCIFVQDSRSSITNATLTALALYCPNLVDIAIVGIKLTVTDEDIVHFTRKCQQLRRFMIHTNSSMTDVAVINLAYNLKQLHFMMLFSQSVSDSGVVAIVQHCRYLQQLVVNGPNISDVTLVAMAEYCHHIQKLELCSCNSITDAGVRELRRCITLTKVDFYDCTSLTDAAIIALVELPNLRTIGMIGLPIITDAALFAVADNCQNIRSVRIERCPLVTAAELFQLTRCCEHGQ